MALANQFALPLAMTKLTKTLVEKTEIKPKPYFVFDEQVSGFCVRVSNNGKRHYYLQYSKNKKIKRTLIGQHGIVTTEHARDEAIKLLGGIIDGADPQQEKMLKRLEATVTELAVRYMNEHALIHCKPRTAVGYQRYLDKRILPFFGGMKISEVDTSDIASFHHSLREMPTEANRCLEVLSKMFNLAELWKLRPDSSNPCKHIRKYKTKKIERYLSRDEVLRLGAVLDEMKRYPDENIAAIYCIQLLMLTGCRSSEIRTLKWEHVDRDAHVLRLPDSKTGAKVVYVGAPVFRLFDEILRHPARPKENPYVIWGLLEGKCLADIQGPWQRYRKAANLEDVRIHDLRHSFASFAVSKGKTLPMIGELLGHTNVVTTARYAHLMSAPMNEAANDISGELSALLQIGTSVEPDAPALPPEETIAGTNIKKPVYLNSQQAADFLGEKFRLMENWRWRKVGPRFTKAGGKIRYELDDLIEYKRSRQDGGDVDMKQAA